MFAKYGLISENENDTVEIGLFGDFFGGLKKCENTLNGENRSFKADSEFEYVDENQSIYFTTGGERTEFRCAWAYGETVFSGENFSEYFDCVHKGVKEEIKNVTVPENLTETEKALFNSCYWCSLENYKELGDYKAFMAGCEYLSPARSYYRDSYYTILPMYRDNIEKVKNQIVALARGINAYGSCPSAVKSDWSEWWGEHYDSPSFFAAALYDYINFTGDTEFADLQIPGGTVFEKAVAAVEYLSKYADGTGLLVKFGRTNKRDWADEVNRYGYVTYDEILYARALYSVANIYRLKGDGDKYLLYSKMYEKVKNAINEILWDDEKGYYVNFINDDYTEDNLSIDTVFAAIFDIADEKRSKRMLSESEKLLETKNNRFGEDFGSMCVYPFYKKINSARNKSTQSFNYHNGANWPYLSAVYAYAKRKFGMEYKSLLTVPFEYNVKKETTLKSNIFHPFARTAHFCRRGRGWVRLCLTRN